MKALVIIGSIAFVVGFAWVVNKWAAVRDIKMQAAAERYEKCVWATYFVGPAEYYAENGEYPICQE